MQNYNNNNNDNNNNNPTVINICDGILQYHPEDTLEQLKNRLEGMITWMAESKNFPTNSTIHVNYIFKNDLDNNDLEYYFQEPLYPELIFNYTTISNESLVSLAYYYPKFQNDIDCTVYLWVFYTIDGHLPNY